MSSNVGSRSVNISRKIEVFFFHVDIFQFFETPAKNAPKIHLVTNYWIMMYDFIIYYNVTIWFSYFIYKNSNLPENSSSYIDLSCAQPKCDFASQLASHFRVERAVVFLPKEAVKCLFRQENNSWDRCWSCPPSWLPRSVDKRCHFQQNGLEMTTNSEPVQRSLFVVNFRDAAMESSSRKTW